MAQMTNWLTFSLSPMEMLRSSDQSHQFVSYDASSAASSSPYLLDNFYGWTNQKPQEFFKEEEAQIAAAASMADSTILTTFADPQTHSHMIPKLEDFLGGDVRYSDNNSQSETQEDSSLSQIYDPRHHHHNHNQNQTGFYSDMAGFQTTFSTNSGSEVDDSASIARTHLPGEYLGHVVESSGPELGFHGGALSLGDNVNNANQRSNDTNQITEHHYRGNNNVERNNNNNSFFLPVPETPLTSPSFSLIPASILSLLLLYYTMATTESSAANSASSQIPPCYSIDPSSSVSRSRPWIAGAIHDDLSPSITLKDPFFPPSDNNDKKPVWNKPCTSSSPPLMGPDSWPALSLSSHKSSSSFDSSKEGSSPMPMPMPMPQAAGAPLSSSINSSAAAATSSDNHNVNNGQRKPFRRNNSTSSSSTSNPPNADQNHTQRSGSATTQSRHSHRPRINGSSYPPGDGLHHGNRRNFEQSEFSHRNSNGRGDMHLQPQQRGFGMMRPPQMLMGSPSFPARSTQYTQIGSYGGPMLYPDYALHVFMPHPPPESMTLVGNFPPPPIYLPSFDPMLYNKILTQVEYYFSADNLSKDKHLRGQMNDEGWVPVRIIARFRRLAELTDNIQTILEALRSSEVVEIKGEALRRRGDWDKYLLPHEPSSAGPAAAGAPLGAQLERMTLSESSREGE